MSHKRILSLLLALIMLVGLFSACSSDSPSSGNNSSQTTGGDDGQTASDGKIDGGGYTVNYLYIVAQEGSNQANVSAALDALAMKDLNMHVNAIPMTFGTYNSQLSVMLAAGDALDIFPSMSNAFSTYIESQYIVDLNDYTEELAGAYEALGEDAMCGLVGNFLVGFGQMKERGYPTGMVVRKDILDEVGYSVSDFNVTVDDYSSFDKVGELLAAVKEKHPEMTGIDGTSVIANGATLSYADNLGDNYGVLENYGQTTTITNYFESEQFRQLSQIAKDWYDAGYISQDIAVNQDSGETKMRAGNTFSFICYVKPNTNIEKLAQTGFETEVIPLGDSMKSTTAVNAPLFSIANASQDKSKAAQFMGWTYQSGEFNDLINWGVEGEDWVETDQGLAAYPDGVDASSVGYHNDFGWVYPNQFAGHPWDGNPADIWDQYRTYNSEMKKSMGFGFTFDSTGVANEEAQLKSVEDQYFKNIACGVVDDIDAAIAEFNEALYAAGLQKVMDAKQEQLNAWLESQK